MGSGSTQLLAYAEAFECGIGVQAGISLLSDNCSVADFLMYGYSLCLGRQP